VFLGCSSGAPAKPTTRPPVGSAAPEPAAKPDPYPDPDNDRILGDCDVCPDGPERPNEYANDDGCPETNDEIYAVSSHPTNQYSGPLFQIAFDTDGSSTPLDRKWQLDDEIEAVACITNATDVALAKKRVAQLCKSLRAAVAGTKVDVRELTSSKPNLYRDPSAIRGEAAKAFGVGIIQVMRAKGTEVWQWKDDQLVRAAAPVVLESRPLPEGCTWVSFVRDRRNDTWLACKPGTCPETGVIHSFRARWDSDPKYPE